jgi:hypothetical protein
MADPMSVTVVGGSATLAALSALANTSDLVQGLDSYLSIVDPGAGCSLDLEPFVLRKSSKPKPKPKPKASAASSRTLPAAKSAASPPPDPGSTMPSFASSEPAGAPIVKWWLIVVENQISALDSLLGETRSPSVIIGLDVLKTDDSVTCVPYLAHLSGFDSRVGNQVSIKCQAVPYSDSAAATIFINVFYNPFYDESGFITTVYSARYDDEFELTYLHARWAPENAFKIGRSPFSGAPIFSPK